MNGQLAYSGINTKMRAMRSHFLREEDYREILGYEDISSIAAYLKKNPNYRAALEDVDEMSLHRSELETYLYLSVLYDFEKLYRFANASQRGFLKRYSRRYEVRLLKDLLNHLFRKVPIAKEYECYFEHFSRYSDLNIRALLEAEDVPDLIRALRGSPYYEPLRDVRNRYGETQLFAYESALDLFHFQTIWRDRKSITKEAEDEKLLTLFYGTKFDLLNLWYIYRARTYYRLDQVSTYALTIPVLYKLKKQDIRNLVEAEDEDGFRQALRNTYYGRGAGGPEPDQLQYEYTRICRQTIRKGMEQHPNSIASLYGYLYEKEHEIYRLVTALECVRYDISPEKALKHVMQR